MTLTVDEHGSHRKLSIDRATLAPDTYLNSNLQQKLPAAVVPPTTVRAGKVHRAHRQNTPWIKFSDMKDQEMTFAIESAETGIRQRLAL